MECKKCRKPIPDDAAYCLYCGVKQTAERRARIRGNGQGTVYKLQSGKWAAVVTIGYYVDNAGKKHRRTRSKSFATKREAVAALPELAHQPEKPQNITLKELYDAWAPKHNAGKSTMGNYQAAIAWFSPLYCYQLADIGIDDLQDCMDDCPRGKSTQTKMKALIGMLYDYAIPRNLASVNLGRYLTPGGSAGTKPGLPLDAVSRILAGYETVSGADMVAANCYLGFRPGELLALKVSDYDPRSRSFTGGSKTDAGRDRIVPVSPKIQHIIDSRLRGKSPDDYIFPAKNGKRMTMERYRFIFFDVLNSFGIPNPTRKVGEMEMHLYTPHSCRHTFATLIKHIQAPDKDKLELIGHTSTEMLRHYQDVNMDDLRLITDML